MFFPFPSLFSVRKHTFRRARKRNYAKSWVSSIERRAINARASINQWAITASQNYKTVQKTATEKISIKSSINANHRSNQLESANIDATWNMESEQNAAMKRILWNVIWILCWLRLFQITKKKTPQVLGELRFVIYTANDDDDDNRSIADKCHVFSYCTHTFLPMC